MLLPVALFCVARIKHAGHGFKVWIATSRVVENEREEGVYMMLYLPLVTTLSPCDFFFGVECQFTIVVV